MKALPHTTPRRAHVMLSVLVSSTLLAFAAGCAGSGSPASGPLPLPVQTGSPTKPSFGFNGETDIFPAMDTFYAAAATAGVLQSTTRCQAYVSWDLAEHSPNHGSGDGSRTWFEAFLKAAKGHCSEVLISFKYVASFSGGNAATSSLGNFYTPANTYPSMAQFEQAVADFMAVNWTTDTYTGGWSGTFVFAPWNEPDNGSSSGDGLTNALPAEVAADYYLALRSICNPANGCSVAAGNFGSNGSMFLDYQQNCANDTENLCNNASYMDQYKYYIAHDAPNFTVYTLNSGAAGAAPLLAEGTAKFTSAGATLAAAGSTSFRPEVFAYHAWDDINNYINLPYINRSLQCPAQPQCTTTTLISSLTGDSWDNVDIWDTEVAAGQDPYTNPDDTTQACAASFLLNLSTVATHRISRIYYTHPHDSTYPDRYWSLFDLSNNPRPALNVLAGLNTSYIPTITTEACP